jgi:hypothetical protein
MGCGCKKGTPVPTPTQTTQSTNLTEQNVVDEQRQAQIKTEIRTIVNKYYNDQNRTKS